MAYMNQEKKAKIAAALKKVVPAGWKYSLSVRHHNTIAMTIKSAPHNLIASLYPDTDRTEVSINTYWAERHLAEGKDKKTILTIIDCLNMDNFDKSDPITDYFYVGHYVSLNIGNWAKPFVVSEQIKKAA